MFFAFMAAVSWFGFAPQNLVMPVVLGTIVIVGVYLLDWFPDWGSFKRYALVATTLLEAESGSGLGAVSASAKNRAIDHS